MRRIIAKMEKNYSKKMERKGKNSIGKLTKKRKNKDKIWQGKEESENIKFTEN